MLTECRTDHLEFEAFDGRKVVGAFDGGAMTSDTGCLLLRQTDNGIGLIDRVVACFSDRRHRRLASSGSPGSVAVKTIPIPAQSDAR